MILKEPFIYIFLIIGLSRNEKRKKKEKKFLSSSHPFNYLLKILKLIRYFFLGAQMGGG